MNRSRRSFRNPLGTELPPPISEREKELCFRLVRTAKLERVRIRAAQRLIEGHMRLGFALVANRAAILHKETDTLVSIMLETLVESVDKIKKGEACEHGNITGYLVACVNGHLNRALSRPIPILKYSISDNRLPKLDSEDELANVLSKSRLNARQLSLIQFRLTGFTYQEIGELMGLATSTVTILFNEICETLRADNELAR